MDLNKPIEFDETAFPPDFTEKYTGPILAMVMLTKTMAKNGEVENLVLFGKVVMTIINAAADIAQQAQGVPPEQWRTGWKI
jgi:hypothetical protein